MVKRAQLGRKAHPSTTIAWPLTKLLMSLARKSAALASSSLQGSARPWQTPDQPDTVPLQRCQTADCSHQPKPSWVSMRTFGHATVAFARFAAEDRLRHARELATSAVREEAEGRTVRPGQSAFARISWPASAVAVVWASEMTAAFDALGPSASLELNQSAPVLDRARVRPDAGDRSGENDRAARYVLAGAGLRLAHGSRGDAAGEEAGSRCR